MLSITHETVEKDIEIGELFDKLGVAKHENAECLNEFDISVSTMGVPRAFRRIQGFRRTQKLPVFRLYFQGGHLDAAGDHLLWVNDGNDCGWKHLKDIRPFTDYVFTAQNEWVRCITKGPEYDREESLFDLQVASESYNGQSYYTNGILSHNSHFLVQMGANAMRAGKNVLHYTFELRDHKVATRYDANFSGISATDVPDEKEFVRQKLEELRPKLGRLVIKEYPTNSATVLTLRAHIEKIAVTKNFRPDVVIVDYADIMRSTRQYDSLRHEMKLVYEELRGLGMELGIPIWTASQSNRESTESDVLGIDKISESFGKAMVCDFIVTLSRKPLVKAKGLGNLFIPKNRLGKDGILFPVKVDTARSIIEILDKNIDIEEFQRTAETNMKKLLKDKWSEVANERMSELRQATEKGEDGPEDGGLDKAAGE